MQFAWNTPGAQSMNDDRIEEELRKARDAIARGRMRAARRHVWQAANAAARRNDQRALEAAGELAAIIRDTVTGARRRQADILCSYCAAALENPRGGHRTLLDFLFPFRRLEPTKRCPECAETVKAAAKLCRFCGYRFE